MESSRISSREISYTMTSLVPPRTKILSCRLTLVLMRYDTDIGDFNVSSLSCWKPFSSNTGILTGELDAAGYNHLSQARSHARQLHTHDYNKRASCRPTHLHFQSFIDPIAGTRGNADRFRARWR